MYAQFAGAYWKTNCAPPNMMKRFKAAFLVVLLSLIVVRYISADERLKFQAKPHQAKRRLLAVPGSGIADLDDDDQSEATIQESLEELTEAIHKPYAPPDSSSKPTKDRKEEMLQKPVRKTKKDDSPKAALNKILTDIERNAEKEGVEVGLELASNIGQNLKKGDLRGAVGAVKETLMSAPEIGNKIITPVEADLPNILRNTNWRKLWKKRRWRLSVTFSRLVREWYILLYILFFIFPRDTLFSSHTCTW